VRAPRPDEKYKCPKMHSPVTQRASGGERLIAGFALKRYGGSPSEAEVLSELSLGSWGLR